ncbi:zinc finger protein [Lentzea sp. NPDC102401]|uniref:zinc finger protein n=1 Tax=Lentzea sp. NPDC102401 TaxID=3364128 RepID=UPI0038100725
MGAHYSDFAVIPPFCWADVQVEHSAKTDSARHAVKRELCPEDSYIVHAGATLCGIAVTSVNATRHLQTCPTCEECDDAWRKHVKQKTFKELKQIPAQERRKLRLLADAA